MFRTVFVLLLLVGSSRSHLVHRLSSNHIANQLAECEHIVHSPQPPARVIVPLKGLGGRSTPSCAARFGTRCGRDCERGSVGPTTATRIAALHRTTSERLPRFTLMCCCWQLSSKVLFASVSTQRTTPRYQPPFFPFPFPPGPPCSSSSCFARSAGTALAYDGCLHGVAVCFAGTWILLRAHHVPY